ncbi:hypothetical protein PC119_g877 [Phytophthora cactorum]|uniref:DUF7769 domain-containing protein n=1 Tax=Phytophthora cactorum TaxID=29920 RepID=A0A8T1ELZ1_9STRA|nr:hypothetical protein PC114_g523 [Phytophthora cactorum]KAG2952602.1 hypothetical protein PC117_g2620 [Phytophthora cactorum]KAG3041167.1 hypothetical protein PC119_g877 [Phytophthora cactorum]
MPSTTPTKRRELSDSEREQVVMSLLQRLVEGVPRRGAINEVATLFRVHRRTISRLWERAKEQEAETGRLHAVSHRHDRGRPMMDLSVRLENLRITPFQRRRTIRSASMASGVSRATLQRRVSSGDLVAATSTVKPLLTDENKTERLDGRRYYLLPGEEAPHRQVRSRRYTTKVMMLAAVARPRWDTASNSYFNGKLDIWSFIVQEPAVRSSARRPFGAIVTKEGRVTKETSRKMLIERLLPAIRERWPSAGGGVHLWVQQDNAPAHITATDAASVAGTSQQGLDVELCCQPPNSPDLNCLDLGLFAAIQAHQRLRSPRNIDELVDAVTAAYWELFPRRSMRHS